MKILLALDLGADGTDLRIWLDTTRSVKGPEGDEQPDPAYVWRTIVPAGQFHPLNSMPHILALAEAELKRRVPVRITGLEGVILKESAK